MNFPFIKRLFAKEAPKRSGCFRCGNWFESRELSTIRGASGQIEDLCPDCLRTTYHERKSLKTLLIVLALGIMAALLVGCTITEVKTPYWSLNRVSILQKVEMPEVSIDTNGTATLKGYKSDGGADASAAITAAAVSAAIQSAKP